ncbi:LANO_0C09032g1_1 [Lachancea nothofagi CBS 11611]|uniref:LANO_0C09032g1_1 n=1 Tax=Lachancea nothofagi CBS 11611 TaxID=1266666 RepID=A0A1G4J9R0_9SACH|nr:LANO_0C09032g1_1 [Lachancea nothofagi CBS 11611]
MSSSIWNALLEAHREPQTKLNADLTLVLSAESQPALQDFLVRVLQVEDEKSSLASIGYFHKELSFLRGDIAEELVVHIYTVAWPLTATVVDLLSIFVNSEISGVRWVFLLDWLEGNHKSWLRGLCESFELLRHKLGRNLEELDFCSVVGLHAQNCTNMELTSPHWNSLKMEFMNQTLRSFALIKHASLLSLEEETPAERLLEVCKIVLGQESSQEPEYITMSKLFVPQGSDSARKIKTMGEEFPVTQIEQETFIGGQFERIIPGEMMTPSTDLLSEEEPVINLKEVDVQKELADVYKLQKSSLLSSVAAHNATIDIPNAEKAHEHNISIEP